MDAYSKITTFYSIENISTEEVMDKRDMSQEIFGNFDEFGWWYKERIQTYAGMQFTPKEFQEGLSVHGVRLPLEAPHHQQNIAHSVMVHARVFDKYINFA